MKNQLLKKQLWLAFAGLLLLPFQAMAGGWPQPKGNGYFKFDQSWMRSTSVFDGDGKRLPLRTIGYYSTAFYGEYGFTKRLTGIAFAPFLVQSTLNRTVGRQTGNELEPAADNRKIGDFDLGVKYGWIVGKPVVFSTTLRFGLPTGDASDPDALFTGDGEFNQLLLAEAGAGFGRTWLSGGLGLNNRTGGFSDEVVYQFEAGRKLLRDRPLVILKINGNETLNNGKSDNPGGMGLFANNVRQLSVGPEIAWKLSDKWGLAARALTPVFGRNILPSTNWSVGIFYELKKKG